MTSLYPQAPYAEDQPHAHQVLYLHTARAGAMIGSFVSLLTATTSTLLSHRKHNPSPLPVPFRTNLTHTFLTHAPHGLLAGALFGVTATFAQMRGRQEVEWQDRSWRLLGNKGEVWTDWVAVGGAGLGGVVGGMAGSRGKGIGMARGVLGGVGVGMAAGVVFMVGRMGLGKKEG
ncbi:hypothetical protein DM02DRAFT_610323 [Periconia macrospinosa]|uniref:Uncharacterized protein n=1 Tax=Periconia macrospinosa TaxID=97972 RepID=A0A2V1E615_9PLEO|nr:hypothetical protein DM02DRAFT_610323 [Periconia macrospinosa]